MMSIQPVNVATQMLFVHHELAREASLVKPLGQSEVVEHIFFCEACVFLEPSDVDISLALSLSAREIKNVLANHFAILYPLYVCCTWTIYLTQTNTEFN